MRLPYRIASQRLRRTGIKCKNFMWPCTIAMGLGCRRCWISRIMMRCPDSPKCYVQEWSQCGTPDRDPQDTFGTAGAEAARNR